ncbi:hypothetical protein KI387_044434, partial [Taxus chinensis]
MADEEEIPQPIVPWGRNTGLLALEPPLHDLPMGSHKNFPKFKGDNTQHPEEHITTFTTSCGILGVQHEDVA